MKITQKIRAIRRAIEANPGGATDIRIQTQSIAAILGGNNTADWQAYMSNFHSNQDQLNRLMGNDIPFMTHPSGWGPKILAYVVSGGPCGGGTGLSIPDKMDSSFKALLDWNLPTADVVGVSEPLTPEAQFIFDLENDGVVDDD